MGAAGPWNIEFLSHPLGLRVGGRKFGTLASRGFERCSREQIPASRHRNEAIGEDIARRQQQEIDGAVQLDLPIIVGQPLPILYVEMDSTGVPVVKKETADRKGKLGCVLAQTKWDKEGFALRDLDSTTYAFAKTRSR